MKKLPIKIPLLLIISYLFCFNVQAETETTTDTAPIEVSTEASSMLKAEKLLANIYQLSDQAIELKQKFKEAPAIDLLLFFSLVMETEKELRSDLDNLIVIQQKIDVNSPESLRLLQEAQEISILQAAILKEESVGLEKVINQLRNEDNQDNKTKFSIERAKQAKYKLLTAWQQNIERQKLLNMDVAQSSRDLGDTVQFIAIAQTGRIRLILDAKNELNS